jgi:pimeloyl-ACP methyl ester carboxylesterase
MFIKGSGVPIVLIPGLHGRWEWTRPAVEALSRHHRVIAFSLCDERTSPFPCDPDRAFENYVSQVGLALDRAGLDRAVIAGVSYGGLIAAEFAARHPDRVSALVLASALHASWTPNDEQQRYLKSPILMSPVFVATSPGRIHPEIVAAFPQFGERIRFTARQGVRAVMAPTSPFRMARRMAWAKSHHFANPRRVTAPALLVTGEPGLDRVLPVDVSRRYLDDLDKAEYVMLKNTGHMGILTKPDAFAGVLERFMDAARIPA